MSNNAIGFPGMVNDEFETAVLKFTAYEKWSKAQAISSGGGVRRGIRFCSVACRKTSSRTAYSLRR